MNGWTITWGERTWTDEDVTGADLLSIGLLIGDSWENCDPFRGPQQLMAMIAALECRTSERDLDDVMAEISASPATELLGALSARVEVVDGAL